MAKGGLAREHTWLRKAALANTACQLPLAKGWISWPTVKAPLLSGAADLRAWNGFGEEVVPFWVRELEKEERAGKRLEGAGYDEREGARNNSASVVKKEGQAKKRE